MLWSPVAFALGAAAYLALKSEPSWSLLALVALALGVLAVWSRGWTRWSGLAVPLTLMAFAAAGALAGKVRCDRVAAPVMPAERGVRVVDGFVVDVVSPGAAGPRLLIAPVSVSRLAPEVTPTRIRVSLPEGTEAPPPGSQLRLRAMLSAPPPPAAPGSHDFARDAWFNGIGGVGFTVGEIEETTLDPPPWRLRLAMAINAMRWSLASRIVERLGPDSGGIAAAMVTGHEAWITADQTEAMRASGLAHILSISGLHMAIVGGFVFAAVRLLVAAWPWAALRFPGKKIAAIAGLAAVGAYLVVSGAPPPAVRAAITAGVAFLAILADRQAVTLHGLALAALIILIAQPEQAGAAGFQMSFAATAALVALAEAWPRQPREISVPWPIRFTQGAMAWLAISVGASFVAGLATGPFSMQHFNRVAIWGLPANLVVSPLSSFVIMPFLAVGAALEPLGLGGPFLAVAGWGIDAMTAVARWFASAHGAQHTVASAPAFTLVLSFLGIMLLCLWKGRLRWLGVPLFLAVSLWPRPTPPDLWISADGATAVARRGGEAVLLRPDARRFGTELWARRRGLAPVDGGGFACDRTSCRPEKAAPVAVSLSWTRRAPGFEALQGLCAGAEVVILRGSRPAVLPVACRDAVVLAGEDFAAGGAAELWRREGGWWIVWTTPGRGRRPWTTTADTIAQDPGG